MCQPPFTLMVCYVVEELRPKSMELLRNLLIIRLSRVESCVGHQARECEKLPASTVSERQPQSTPFNKTQRPAPAL
jgi:hypothetical protein